MLLVEELGQFDRLAEVDPDAAKTLFADGVDDLEKVEDRLLLLARAAQFTQVGAAFQHPFVADIHRHEDDRQAVAAQEAAQGDGQHAGFRLQHASGARAPALDEILHREALAEQAVQVFVEHRGVQRVALEGAAHKEGAAATQQAADHRHIEVDPGGDMRRGQAVGKQQVGQQQVVDMAAVAGHIDHLMAVGDLLHGLDMLDLDAVVDLVPEPAEHHFEEADGGVGVVRGDLVAVAQGLGLDLFQRQLAALDFVGNRLMHLRAVDQALDQVAPVGNVRAYDRGFLVAKMHPQQALDHPPGALLAFALGHQLTQLQRGGELHAGLAPQDQDAQQLAQAPGDRPAVGKQQLPGAGFAGRGLPPEHADRHDLRVQAGIARQGVEQAQQGGCGAALVLAAQPAGFRGQVEERARLMQGADADRQDRPRQASLAALAIDHRQIADRGQLQHIEHRPAAIELEGEGGLIDGLRAHPQVQQAMQGTKDKTAKWRTGHTNSAAERKKRAFARGWQSISRLPAKVPAGSGRIAAPGGLGRCNRVQLIANPSVLLGCRRTPYSPPAFSRPVSPAAPGLARCGRGVDRVDREHD